MKGENVSLGLSTIDDTTETCRECYKGQVTPNGGTGRAFLLSRGCRVALPDSFQVPTCDTCGELFWSQSLREEAAALVTIHIFGGTPPPIPERRRRSMLDDAANLRRDGERAAVFTLNEAKEESHDDPKE